MLDPAALIRDLDLVREQSPLVHNITNYVVMNTTANALLALGASPVMAHAPEEMEEMTSLAAALVCNIGTLSAPWITAMKLAARTAVRRGIPFILDPVGAGATDFRTRTARELMETARPAVIRGNGSEIMALAARAGSTRGVDSTVSSTSALETAKGFAATHGVVLSLSGATDYITDGTRVLEVANGTPLMTRVTGLGCTASALTGAFCAVNPDPLVAAAHAMAVMGICGELAAAEAEGPASLQTRFLDRLYTLNAADIRNTLR